MEGVYTVLVTPFDINNNIDYQDIDKLILNQINTGVKGIILLGTTSESPTINANEKEEIVKYVWSKYNNKIRIIVGIGGNNTMETIEFGKICQDKCDGFMVTVPNYNKPTQDGIFEHFVEIAISLKSKPIMLYNIPSRCGVNMEPNTIIDLCKTCENIKAIKEASGSLEQIRKIKQKCSIKIYSGDDVNVIPIMSLGAVGLISVASNLIPTALCNIVDNCLKNNYDSALQSFYNYYDFMNALFVVSNPIPLKYLLFKNNVIKNSNVRLPLTKISDVKIIKMLNQYVSEENKFFERNFEINDYLKIN